MPSDLRPSSSLTHAELAQIFTAAYEGYLLPFQIDVPTLEFMVDSFDIDLDASRVAFRDGQPIGLANLALRGDEGWIGGVGVVPAARRQGFGEELMDALHDEARARGATTVWLEVIVENESAFRLYEKLGYEVVREVEVWSLSAEQPTGGAREVPLSRAQARIGETRTGREPWQRSDATVANYADARGLETDDGAALFRVGARVQLIQITDADASDLIRTMRAHGTITALNFAVDDPAVDVLRELGGELVVRQREMMLRL